MLGCVGGSEATRMHSTSMMRHDIELCDVRDGQLVVTYAAEAENPTARMRRYVSARLPFECLTLFDGGTVDVADLTAEERAWVRSESAYYGNEIDFDGVRT